MGKTGFLLSIFLLSILGGYAQKGKEMIFGLGGALTNVWIVNQNFYGEPEVDYAPKIGYGFNATIGYAFTEQIAAVTEIQYSRQGQKYEGRQAFTDPNTGITYNFTKVERDINLNYLNIPLFFKYTFGAGGTRFRFLAGPQLGLLMSAKQTYERDGEVIGTELENKDGETFVSDVEEIDDRYESTDFGVALDVGADIYLSKQFFVGAGARINYGFTDINAPAYQLPAPSEPYEPSHNLFGGLYVSINYLLDVEGYKQRSF